MKAHPFLINQDASGRRLQPPHSEDRPFKEDWLQELLRKYPDILPVAEIESVFYPLVSIGREVSTASGPIDNLFISHSGYLVLVETKLWRNPESRREVVAQAIDYGSSLSKWNYEKLNDAVRLYTKKYEHAELDLIDWVEHKLGPVERGRDFFEEAVAKNLKLGRFLTLVVGDKIRQPVIDMVSYVNRHPGLAIEVALVELQCFLTNENENWPLLVVPRIVARTEIIERSVVEVTVVNGDVPQVEVRQEKAEIKEGKRKRVSLAEGDFWEQLKERSPDSFDKARQLIASYTGRDGIEVTTTDSSVSVKADIQGTGQQVPLFYISKKGGLNSWPKYIREKLVVAGFNPDIASTYEIKLRELLQMPEARIDLARFIIEVDVNQFKSIVDKFIESIQRAKPLEE